MPYSSGVFDQFVIDLVLNCVEKRQKLLDVGAGAGKWGFYFREYFENVRALEPHKPYISQFKLHEVYDSISSETIQEFSFSESYDLVVFGDVFEHLNMLDAKALIKTLDERKQRSVFIIPYLYPQKKVYGNALEEHLQPDLTPGIMEFRYPELDLEKKNDSLGVYSLWMSQL